MANADDENVRNPRKNFGFEGPCQEPANHPCSRNILHPPASPKQSGISSPTMTFLLHKNHLRRRSRRASFPQLQSPPLCAFPHYGDPVAGIVKLAKPPASCVFIHPFGN